MTRPMALQQIEGEQEQDEERSTEQMLASHHRQTLWIPWTLVLLGTWMLVAPFTFGYLNEELWTQPSGGRGAWFADTATYESLRAQLTTWSDVVSGALPRRSRCSRAGRRPGSGRSAGRRSPAR